MIVGVTVRAVVVAPIGIGRLVGIEVGETIHDPVLSE